MIPDGFWLHAEHHIHLGNFRQQVFSVCFSEHTVSKPGRKRQHGHAERDSKSKLCFTLKIWLKGEHNLSAVNSFNTYAASIAT